MAEPKRLAHVRGTVVDRASGAPWPRVEVRVSGRLFQVRTDNNGRYELPYYWQAHKITVMFFAPTRTNRARLITAKEILINRGEVVTVDVVAHAARFADPPLETIHGVFTGRFSWGFEASDLEPDDGRVPALDGRSRDIHDAWVDFVGPALPPPFAWDRWYRVTWSGGLTGPGSYGHMGVSEYLMEVEEVREWREDDKCVSG